MVKVIFDKKFESFISKIKDNLLKEKVIKQEANLTRILGNPILRVERGTRVPYVRQEGFEF